MIYAIRLIESLKLDLREFLENELAFNREDADLKRVQRVIREAPGIDHSKLLRNSHVRSRNMRDILQTLLESGAVCREVEKSGKRSVVRYWETDGHGA